MTFDPTKQYGCFIVVSEEHEPTDEMWSQAKDVLFQRLQEVVPAAFLPQIEWVRARTPEIDRRYSWSIRTNAERGPLPIGEAWTLGWKYTPASNPSAAKRSAVLLAVQQR